MSDTKLLEFVISNECGEKNIWCGERLCPICGPKQRRCPICGSWISEPCTHMLRSGVLKPEYYSQAKINLLVKLESYAKFNAAMEELSKS